MGVVAKSTTERDNSNILHKANSSTPFYRAFFVRSTRIPKKHFNLGKEYQEQQESQEYPPNFIIFLSMVACNGKGLALCCIPCVAVCHPVTRYRPIVTNKAVTSEISHKELLAMIYLLLCVNRTKPTFNTEVVRIQAPNEDEARYQLTADYQLLKVCGRLNPQHFSKTNPKLLTCNQIQGGFYA
ncbi:hypothetical protein A6B44_01230 [Pasteurella skyensis]|nr:hypothetical protein A6B44_01230 [Pasteurella skyensis]